jgi:predicted TIM-barrel fold metal-dependent hydrolase
VNDVLATAALLNRKARPRHARHGLVDCDVHPTLRSHDALKPYLAQRWHAEYEQFPGRESRGTLAGARPGRSFNRDDAVPPGGGPPGSDYDFLREQLLDRWQVDRAILSLQGHHQWVQYGEISAAWTRAANDWLVEQWLDRDDRFFCSIVVPTDDGAIAAAEVARAAAADARFVQVFMPVTTAAPLGHSRFWPLFEVAESLDLPIALHPGGFGGQITGVGFPSYFAEFHNSIAYAYWPHVVTLIHSGAFARFPRLKIVLVEGGIAWMPPLMWRLDRLFQTTPSLAPRLEELPSATIRRHFWFTTQPMEEPEQPRYLEDVLDALGMDDHIMFSSDYPHWDFDAPDRALAHLEPDLQARIFATNANALYSFER